MGKANHLLRAKVVYWFSKYGHSDNSDKNREPMLYEVGRSFAAYGISCPPAAIDSQIQPWLLRPILLCIIH